MVDSALSILRRHPSHSRHFFKTPVDFSTALVSEALQLLVEEGEFDLFYRASARFAGQFPDYEAGFFAVAYPAHIADYTDADLEAVLRRYRAASLFPDYYGIWDRVTNRHYYGHDGERRSKAIEEFISYETETVVPKVELRLGFEDQYPVLDTLALGTPVRVLYSNRPLIRTSFNSIVAVKVRLQDGRVPVRQPRVHDRRPEEHFTSAILPPYLRRTPSIDALIPLLYLKGISTNAFPDALRAILGDGVVGLSATNIVRLKQVWEQEFAAWGQRDLGWIESDEIGDPGPRKEAMILEAAQPRTPGWDMHLANAQGTLSSRAPQSSVRQSLASCRT